MKKSLWIGLAALAVLIAVFVLLFGGRADKAPASETQPEQTAEPAAQAAEAAAEAAEENQPAESQSAEEASEEDNEFTPLEIQEEYVVDYGEPDDEGGGDDSGYEGAFG